MIEEMLKNKGVREEKLREFARLPKHNGKEDIFISIITATAWWRLKENYFLRNLAEVLVEVGITLSEMSHDNKKREEYIKMRHGEDGCKLFIAQNMAMEMLKTLITPRRYEQYDESVTLNRIYEDTFNVESDK